MKFAPSISPTKRAVAFFDGQNIFHAAREAFAYGKFNCDVRQPAMRICIANNWELVGVRFYTGMHVRQRNPAAHDFWTQTLREMKSNGVYTFTRPLRYRKRTVRSKSMELCTVFVGEEKGVDVRIALDLMRMAYRQEYDVALVFSQDQDLSEVAHELRLLAREQTRWIKIASAFPQSESFSNKRGVNNTDWIPIDKSTYDQCLMDTGSPK